MNLVRISEDAVINIDRVDGLFQTCGKVKVYVGGADYPFHFDDTMSELRTCESNPLVEIQLEALRMYKTLINSLPDGYPIPVDGGYR